MNKLYKLIEHISYKERQNRNLEKHREKLREYEEKDVDELEMIYIDIKANYEYKRLTLIFIVGTVFISMLMNVWKQFFNVFQKLLLMLYGVDEMSEQIATVSMFVSVIFVLVVSIIIVLIIVNSFYNMKKAIKEKIFIEEFIKKKG